MLKRSLVLATAATAVAIVVPAGSSVADDTQGGCELSGKAKVTPGLTTEDHAIDFSFRGHLADCQGTGGVTGGKITAKGGGTGSCGGNDTKGRAKVVWNTSQKSIIKFTTLGTGPHVSVAGKITKGVFKGEPVNADLVFQTDHPQDCADGGVADPTFDGTASIGP